MPILRILNFINFQAKVFKLEPLLVCAICKVESDLDPFAVRYEKNYKWIYENAFTSTKPHNCSIDTEIILQKMSIGLMQVMGAVYREYGYKGWLTEIMGDINLQLIYGCKHLKYKTDQYGIIEGIAAYNSGSPRYRDNGELVNQSYVDKVLKAKENYEKTTKEEN